MALGEQLSKMLAAAKVLPLRYWNDPVLSTVCDKIEDGEFGAQLEEFGRELIATMLDKNGVGLAAPQVGVAKRVFAMSFPDHEEMEPRVVCNPEIRFVGAEVALREGCLSMPGIYLQVIRAEHAVMQFQQPDGKHIEIPLITAWDARVAQHELDHLNGVFFINRVSRQMRRQALRDWEKVKAKRGL